MFPLSPPPDVIEVAPVGILDVESTDEMLKDLRRRAGPHARVLADLSRVTYISPRARRHAAEAMEAGFAERWAVLGASTWVRDLVLRAHAPGVKRFSDVSAARAWLDA